MVMMKTNIPALILAVVAVALGASCAPTVRLDTPEPVKIDVSMKVDVYTHEEKTSGGSTTSEKELTAEEQRRNRMAEVQNLKNDLIIGEAQNGMLKVKEVPVDPVYADYVQRVVAQENEDRTEIFRREAAGKDKPVEVIANEFAKRARESAFPGEWIQLSSGEWKKK